MTIKRQTPSLFVVPIQGLIRTSLVQCSCKNRTIRFKVIDLNQGNEF